MRLKEKKFMESHFQMISESLCNKSWTVSANYQPPFHFKNVAYILNIHGELFISILFD
jgi:hypothetical protein